MCALWGDPPDKQSARICQDRFKKAGEMQFKGAVSWWKPCCEAFWWKAAR